MSYQSTSPSGHKQGSGLCAPQSCPPAVSSPLTQSTSAEPSTEIDQAVTPRKMQLFSHELGLHSSSGTPETEVAGSPFSPFPPNTTPMTEAKSEVGSNPDTDLTAVSQTLEPIQENLNDTADDSRYPSPPGNTPAFSPPPSVKSYSAFKGRHRGLSTVYARLQDLKLDDRSSVPSVDEGSEGEHGGVDIKVRAPVKSSRMAHHSFKQAYQRSLENKGDDKEEEGTGGDGVLEKSTWADDVENDLEHALLRLEQLAADEHVLDKSVSAREHYLKRLSKFLAAEVRMHPVQVAPVEDA